MIFQPRSGSTVVRHFLSSASGRIDLGEIFNHKIKTTDLYINGNAVLVSQHGESIVDTLPESALFDRSLSYLDKFSQLTNIKTYSVFGVFEQSFMDDFPKLNELLSKRSDVQFIRQERADLLYSLISVAICTRTSIFHNNLNETKTSVLEREVSPFHLNTNFIIDECNSYIRKQDIIKKYFGEIPVIYYEEFQNRPSNLLRMFSGFPKTLVSLQTGKFAGNYKDLVTNLDEIEEIYEKFVNDHPDYFPQYAGKIVGLEIPVSQGKQPRIRN